MTGRSAEALLRRRERYEDLGKPAIVSEAAEAARRRLARENIARCKAFKASGCKVVSRPHMPRSVVPRSESLLPE